KIFDRLYQPDPNSAESRKGLGLGLAIAKGIVEMHGGSMWADSNYGVCTKICLTLPKHDLTDVIETYLEREGIYHADLTVLKVALDYPHTITDPKLLQNICREVAVNVKRNVISSRDLVLQGEMINNKIGNVTVICQTDLEGGK